LGQCSRVTAPTNNATTVGGAQFDLTLTGAGFVTGPQVTWNAAGAVTNLATSPVTNVGPATQVTATVPAGLLTAADVVYVGYPGAAYLLPFYINGVTAPPSNTDAETGANPAAASTTISAQATGTGTISVADFPSNPTSVAPPAGAGGFTDVNIAPGSTFTQVAVKICPTNGGTQAYWFNGTTWLLVIPQQPVAPAPCIAITIDANSSPNLSQVTGTVIAFQPPLPPPSSGGGGGVPVATPAPAPAPAPAPIPGVELVGPANGAQLDGLGTPLRWTNPEGITQYQIQVIPFAGDGPGIDLIRDAEASYNVLAPTFGAGEGNYVMLPGMTYFWRVRTTTSMWPAAGLTESDWSAWTSRTFRTAAASSATISPVTAAFSSLTPALVWRNADPSVFYYEVQVSKDQDFGSGPGAPFLYWEVRHGGATTPANSYTIPSAFPLEAAAGYFWRVRPRVQGDGSPLAWSPAWSFTTP
ncbi:MAG: hypothetical protein AAB289_12275, partial [Chloroflexota bacterium]